MMFDKIFSGTKYLERGLDAASLRTQVIQNNIANAETPGFKSSRVAFESVFRDALQAKSGFTTKVTRDKHRSFTTDVNSVEAAVIQNSNTTMRMDENNVDIDYENTQLAKNQIYYSALVQQLNSEFARLRMAIREGG